MESIHDYLKNGGARKKKRTAKLKQLDENEGRIIKPRKRRKNNREFDKYGIDFGYGENYLTDDEEDDDLNPRQSI